MAPRVLTTLLIALVCLAQVAPPAGGGRKVETLAPGVELISIRRGNFSEGATGDRWTIWALVIDPKLARLRLAQAMDEIAGAETTSSMAARHGALAAVNGGYFRTTGIVRGEPVGALIIGGRVLSEPVRNRATLAVRDDGQRLRAAIAHLTVNAELQIDGNLRNSGAGKIAGLNRPREKDELVIFTPEFHRTTLTGPDGIELTVEKNRVTLIADGAGSRQIPHDGFVISANGSARDWVRANLRRGSRVEIRTEVKAEPPIPFSPDFILGGGPQLVSAGKAVFAAEADRYSESLYRQRHPRTAIGWRTDGKLVLVTVDGRQKQSVGMNMDELAGLMRELECIVAMNLDGGGSTTMVVKNKVVNSPSDAAGERAVSDALLVFPR